MDVLDRALMLVCVVLLGAFAVLLACGAVLLVAAMPHLLAAIGGK